MGNRHWVLCPGTGQRPTAIQLYRQSRYKLIGQCPSCAWWVCLTKAEVLHRHKAHDADGMMRTGPDWRPT